MKKIRKSPAELSAMQADRDNGMSIRAIAKKHGCSATFTYKSTSPAKVKGISDIDRLSILPRKTKVKRPEGDTDAIVRVLTSVPDAFQAPRRGFGW